MADERSKPPYNQKSPVLEQYGWPNSAPTLALPRMRGRGLSFGDELFDHYRHTQTIRDRPPFLEVMG
jgi:type I restriction enzyme M protein